jgi:MFS family permease
MDALEAISPRIAIASFVGTALEFYDFYIYGTAAAIVFGPTFFPVGSDTAQWLALASFAIVFIARPVGAVIFGHIGDRQGRTAALAASLLLTGISTMLIGILPGYRDIGVGAPLALCILRFAQGIGFGGEWAGAVLLVVESAPVKRRGWWAVFPQLGAPVGFIGANAVFLVLTELLGSDQFVIWGWRLAFLFSAVLVAAGFYVRLTLSETPLFQAMLSREKPARMPLGLLLRRHGGRMILGALAVVACYTLFYFGTTLSLSYGTAVLRLSRTHFLGLECVAVVAIALATMVSGWLADRFGRNHVLLGGLALTAMSGFLFDRMLGSGYVPTVMLFLFIELLLMGVTLAPMGAWLPELFPTGVRYSGASLSCNLGSILGASLTPYVAQGLADRGGLSWVGAYLAVVCFISFLAVLMLGEMTSADSADQLSDGAPDLPYNAGDGIEAAQSAPSSAS